MTNSRRLMAGMGAPSQVPPPIIAVGTAGCRRFERVMSLPGLGSAGPWGRPERELLFAMEADDGRSRDVSRACSSLSFADHIGGALLTSGASGHLGSTRTWIAVR